MRFVLQAGVTISAVMCLAGQALAWDTGALSSSTHRLIVERGVGLVNKWYPGAYPELSNNTYLEHLRKGANTESHEGKAHGGNNWGCSDIGGWWQDALTSYKAGNKTDAYYKLGCMMHLVCDLGVPAHASHILHGIRIDLKTYGSGISFGNSPPSGGIGIVVHEFHIDGFEFWSNSYWGPEKKPIKDPNTDFNGVGHGDPRYSDPSQYYFLNHAWTLADIRGGIRGPKANGWVWIGRKSYWNPPSDTSERAAKTGDYGKEDWDSIVWNWSRNPIEERWMSSYRQNSSSFIAAWSLHSAMEQFKATGKMTFKPSEMPQKPAPIWTTSSAPAPANDNFESRIVLTGESGSATVSNAGATAEPNEPWFQNEPDGVKSVWYEWTASSSGLHAFDSDGSDCDTLIVVYKGKSLDNLSIVAWNDDIDQLDANSPDDDGDETDPDGYACFYAEAGQTYQIAIMGADPEEAGNIILNHYSESDANFTSQETYTQNAYGAVAASNGSMAFVSGTTKTCLRQGTTTRGRKIGLWESPDVSALTLTILDRDGRRVVDQVRPEGIEPNEAFRVAAFDGQVLLLDAFGQRPHGIDEFWGTGSDLEQERHRIRLVSYAVGGPQGLVRLGQASVDDCQSASIQAGRIVVQVADAGSDAKRVFASGLKVFNLEMNLLWQLESSDATLVRVFDNDVACRVRNRTGGQEIIFTQQDRLLVTHAITATNPDLLHFRPDASGGVLWWTVDEDQNVTSGVSYIDASGFVRLNGVAIQGLTGSWNCEFFDGTYLYASQDTDQQSTIFCVRIDPGAGTAAVLNSVSPANFTELVPGDNVIYALTQKDSDTTPKGGVIGYDRELANILYTSPVEDGTVEYLTGDTFVRTHEISKSHEGIFLNHRMKSITCYDIFDNSGVIARHCLESDNVSDPVPFPCFGLPVAAAVLMGGLLAGVVRSSRRQRDSRVRHTG